MFEILLQSRLIELRQEFRVRGGVKSANVVDQLTLAHMMFTVGTDEPLASKILISVGANLVFALPGRASGKGEHKVRRYGME